MKKFERIMVATIGMSIICVGVAMVAKTRVGSDCLTLILQACNNNFGLTLGAWNTIFGIVCLIVALMLDRNKIGYATFYYVIVGQYIIDGTTYILPTPNSYFIDALYCVVALLLISFGAAFGISARLGMSYYDAFCFSVSEKLKIKYVYFRFALEAVFLIVSIILHTYPGFGTIFYFLTMGPCISFILNKIKKPIRKYLQLDKEL